METFDPTRLFEIKGQVSTVTPAILTGTVNNNQSIKTAVTGKRIRVMGWEAQGVGPAISNLVFKSASGGSAISQKYYFSYLDIISMPITDSGYFETNTSEALVCDIAGDVINLTVYYITYTP